MDEDAWEAARIIPVSGIKGAAEQERRGTSALLAVLSSVREFSRALLGPLGAPAGAVQAFIEVPFDHGDRQVRPDGVIRVVRGKRSWTALVEVKTGSNELEASQIEAYLDVARDNGFDVVLTISNELVAAAGEHPTAVDRRKTKKVALSHLPWSQIHTEAVIERTNRSVMDPEQAWILAELVRYLEHPNSGAVDFEDMGQDWPTIRDAAANSSLRANDRGVEQLVGRYSQLMSFAGMRLSRQLGVDVRPSLTRAELQDVAGRTQRSVATLVEQGLLRGALQVPHAAAALNINADLRSGRVNCAASIEAPKQGQPATRVRWLVRQLVDAPDDLLIEATAARVRGPGPCYTLREVREDPRLLVADPTRELRSFEVRLSARAGIKRGAGRGSFVSSVLDLVDAFYASVLQDLKPWTPPAPAVRPQAGVTEDGQEADISNELPLRVTPRETVDDGHEEAEETGPIPGTDGAEPGAAPASP